MRLWSLAPELLDSKGLVASWREGLLALNVLKGNTKGYKNHPQLDRFKNHSNPVQAINNYLHAICDEADRRGYNFNRAKLDEFLQVEKIPCNTKQLDYEFNFLKQKVLKRTGDWKYGEYMMCECINPTFYSVYGEIESWEKVK